MVTRIASHRRRVRPSAVLCVVLVLGLTLGACGGEDTPTSLDGSHRAAESDPTDTRSEPGEGPEDPAEDALAVEPVAQLSDDLARQNEARLAGASLEIPTIGVSTPLVSLGLEADRTMAVPSNFSRAGWYRYSPVPGDAGPAVIAGHVDGRSGPAVFYELTDLAPGDRVVVNYADGTRAEFAVNRVEQHAKDAFPHAEVYGDTPGSELRLITCGGIFDRSRGAHRDNVIVYASAVH